MTTTDLVDGRPRDIIERRVTVNKELNRAILGDNEGDNIDKILLNLCFGHTTPELAAKDLIALTSSSSSSSSSTISNFSDQIQIIACDYPFLQPHLVDLIHILLEEAPAEFNDTLTQIFTRETGDVTQSDYGLLFEARYRTDTRIQDHIHLNRLFARLLVSSSGGLARVDDAFYIICTVLEDYPGVHKSPDIDVPCAAQYMIWAAKIFLDGCSKRTEREDISTTSEIMNTRGKLWTGEPGLSMDRWYFWKNQFLNIATGGEELQRATREAAALASRAMDLAEKNDN